MVNYLHDSEFEDQALSAMDEIGLPEDEAEEMLEDYLSGY